MEKYNGRPVAGGIAIGPILVYQRSSHAVENIMAEDENAETERFAKAREIAKKQLTDLYEKTTRELGKTHAEIFRSHRQMLDDPDYTRAVTDLIRIRHVSADYAVYVVGQEFSAMFSAMEDVYMQSRAADVEDVSRRMGSVLRGTGGITLEGKDSVILATDDLSPSELLQLDRSRLLAFAVLHGSDNSHTAILARSMNIPALFGVSLRSELTGHPGIVDGNRGIFYADPDDGTLEKYRQMQEKRVRELRRLQRFKGKETVTLDGKKIDLFANIGSVEDADMALANDAGGIGLFRSEFLYLRADTFPTEEEQFEAYRAVAEAMDGREVIIRTMDIGADKHADYFQLPQEENPAMGYRAIRISLNRPDIFKTQLRAILRASCFGNISIMYPMIISLMEVRRIKEVVREVEAELRSGGVPYRNVKQGIMIETPAAVWMSRELAKEVDFFSIGTNDLTQYTLAIDRQNPQLDAFYDAHHPAVMKAVRMTVENGHRAGIRVGICGELGADMTLIEQFLRMGVDGLSVNPASILPVRELIRSCDLRMERQDPGGV